MSTAGGADEHLMTRPAEPSKSKRQNHKDSFTSFRYTRSGVDTVQPVAHEPYGIQLDVAGYQKYLEEKSRLGQAQSNSMKMTI
mmetsp:Transcript_19438/g.49982  ORF Transcript_19438/g.49982 Transcript_19438/m.49982 type:complete len:83 (-) Transcript_19438:336-584(-)